MIDIATFLADRSRCQAPDDASVLAPQSSEAKFNLHRDLLFAAERGWLIEPILSHSKFAFGKSRIAPPTCDPAQIAVLSEQYPRCNWTIDLKGSHLCILSVRAGCRDALRNLCEDKWTWQWTSSFRDNESFFFAFRYDGERLRFLGRRFDGIRALTREPVLVPPSWYASGTSLVWMRRGKLLNLPSWLLDDKGGSGCRQFTDGASTPPRFDQFESDDEAEDVFDGMSSML